VKSFARISILLLIAVLAAVLVFGLLGCQADASPALPNVRRATITAPVVPSLAFAPPLTLAPTTTPLKLPTQTATAIPSLAFAPAFTQTPMLIAQNLPTSPARGDGVLPTRTLTPTVALTLPITATQPPTVNPSDAKPTATRRVPLVFSDANLYIHLPPQASQHQPLRVLYVLHGMGANGDSFAQALIADADRYNWVVVAPTMEYHDYMQPAPLMEDDLKISRMLLDTLDAMPARLNLKLDQHVLLYGFSRGAQLAHRFALLYPERVATVATISAGSYTLPLERAKEGDSEPLAFPFGIGDLEKHLGHPLDAVNFKQISFWIAVGERDNQSSDVPRAFDPYLGVTRIDRARAFSTALQKLGIDTRLVIFPNTGHEITAEMRKGAIQFMREDEIKDNMN
jgi:predicted esterase